MADTATGGRRHFVGRATELDALSRAVAGARDGTGALLLLAGEGGLGKTRLLEELARRSGLPRRRILWGRCPEQAGAPALWPWSQALGGLVDSLDDAELRIQLGGSAAHVAQVVPAVRERLGLPVAHPAQADDNRFRIFGGIAGFLSRAADAAPMLLLFDDLHFADRASLALLDFVVHELGEARVALVGAYRPREMRQAHDARAWMARAAEHVVLSGFRRAEVADFVEARCGVAPPDALVGQLHEVTEGHPYFLDELVRLLERGERLAGGALPELRGRLPEGVREAIRRRLASLSAHDRGLLDLAAVLGRTFSIATLQRASGSPPEHVLEELSAWTAAGVAEEVPQEPARFRFTHALIREAIYGDLLPAARAHAHRRVAIALEQRSSDGGEPPLGELAYHFYYSAALGDAAKAVDYSARAATRALALGAHEESVAHYERALQALGLLPADEPRRLDLLLALGSALWRAGREGEARDAFRRAVAAARGLGDTASLARAAMGFNSTSALTGTVDEIAAKLLEEALSALGEQDSPLRSLLLSYLSMRLYFAPDRARAKTLARRAVTIAENLDDAASLSIALLAEHYAHWDPDGLAARRAISRRVVAEAGRAGATMVLLEGRMWCAVDALEAGDLATSDIELDALVRQAREEGLARWVAQAELMRGMRALLAARLDAAAAHGERALAVRPAEDRNNAAQFHLVQSFVVHREGAALAAIEPAVRAVLERHPALPIWRAGLALLLADTGRGREAAEILVALTEGDGTAVRRDSNWLPTIALLAEVAALVGHERSAAVLARWLAPFADRIVVVGTGIACYGSVERYLGLAAQAAGNLDEAVRRLEAAVAANGRLEAPALLARTRCDLARALITRDGRGDDGRARELLDDARRAAGAHELVAVAALVDAISGPPAPATSTPPADAVPGRATLRREGDYWTIGCGAVVLRLKDSKGLRHLETLLRNPGREFHVLDLAASNARGGDAPSPVDVGDAGELLDAGARTAYRRRLEELREEAEEARAFNDPERAARAERELQFLAEELARGVGLGGRSRRAASAAERARQNLSRTIGTVVKRIAAESPALGHHLMATIHTGAFCSYDPGPHPSLTWTFDEPEADA